jgi:Trypsin-like peptidase domain/Effector-associated domain 1
MAWNIPELSKALADLYRDKKEIGRVASSAGLDPKFLDLDGRPITTWNEVLQEAKLRTKIRAIVEFAHGEYPENEALRLALDAQAPEPRERDQLLGTKKNSGGHTTMMPGVQFEEVWKALYTGYTKKSLEQMLRTRLTIDLDDIVADGPMKDMAFDLLGNAEREGWTTDLIREAYQFNARNQELLRVYQKYGFAPAVSAQEGGAAVPEVRSLVDGLEKTIKDRLPAFDFAVFREKMALVERQVCRVELDGNAAGTGFLVGPDAVLTNYHVLESVLNGTTPATKVTCRFDYKVLADNSRVEGVVVALHAADWKLDFSPYSAAEQTRTPDDPPPTADELDYALVRLTRRLGDEPAAPKGGAEGPRRGWLTIPGPAPVFVPKMPLMIAQHPDGKPLKLAVDTESVIGVNAGRTRVRYATNTEAGSSGSPVFDLDWNLVALHHLGDPAYDHPAAYNQGVPINKVRLRIAAKGKATALGDAAGGPPA